MPPTVVATNNPVLESGNGDTRQLIELAKASAELDAQLTIRQALKKYKKAVGWALFLSTSLIMEGFDLAIVSAWVSPTLQAKWAQGRSRHSWD